MTKNWELATDEEIAVERSKAMVLYTASMEGRRRKATYNWPLYVDGKHVGRLYVSRDKSTDRWFTIEFLGYILRGVPEKNLRLPEFEGAVQIEWPRSNGVAGKNHHAPAHDVGNAVIWWDASRFDTWHDWVQSECTARVVPYTP